MFEFDLQAEPCWSVCDFSVGVGLQFLRCRQPGVKKKKKKKGASLATSNKHRRQPIKIEERTPWTNSECLVSSPSDQSSVTSRDIFLAYVAGFVVHFKVLSRSLWYKHTVEFWTVFASLDENIYQ